MPTNFGTYNPGDVIQDSHVEAFNSPINNLETGASYYAVDGGGTDAYAATLSPIPASYTPGMVVHFKANTANTGAATLNVNGLGVKNIKKDGGADLETGDILAGQVVAVLYDGTNFQLLSRGRSPVSAQGRSGGQTLVGGTGSAEDLLLQSTSHATKGNISFGSDTIMSLDEGSGNLGLGIASSSLSRFFAKWAPGTATDQAYRPFNLEFNPTFNTSGAGVANSILSLRLSTTVAGSESMTGGVTGMNSRLNVGTDAGTTVTTATSNLAQFALAGAGDVTNARVYTGTVTLNAGAGTLATSDVFLAGSPVLTAGAITTNHGLRVLNQGASGVGTSYALRIAAQSGASTASWAIACDGSSSPSYHMGSFMFGASSAAAKRVEILDTSSQLRLTHTAATDYCDFTVDTNGALTVAPVVGGGAAGSGELKLNVTKYGVYNVTPVARPAAYTQTYAATTRTHAQAAVSTTAASNSSPYGYTSQAQADAIPLAINELKQLVNQMLDDFQAQGHLQ